MTEDDYLKATNRVKISMALNIMRDVLPDDAYGINHNETMVIIKALILAEKKLFASYKLDISNSEIIK